MWNRAGHKLGGCPGISHTSHTTFICPRGAGFGAVVVFLNATFSGNRASGDGGGLSVKTRANATLQLSSLVGNSAYRGGAIAVAGEGSVVLLAGSRATGARHGASLSSYAPGLIFIMGYLALDASGRLCLLRLTARFAFPLPLGNDANLGAAFDLSGATDPPAQLQLRGSTVQSNAAGIAGGTFLLPRVAGVTSPQCVGQCSVNGNTALSYGPESACPPPGVASRHVHNSLLCAWIRVGLSVPLSV